MLLRIVWRWDLTSDHRYTISAETKQELQRLDDSLVVTFCLNGTLNPGFQKLRNASLDLLYEFRTISPCIHIELPKEERMNDIQKQLDEVGIGPFVIHEHSQKGHMAQTILFPYAILQYHNKQTVVNLLQQDRTQSGEENLNQSIEGLEYSFVTAIHTLQKNETERIAFLEGHGELTEEDVYDWSSLLSRFYQVDRGALTNDADILMGYKAIIVADPQQVFSDTDKYIIDQYLMQGGKIMWLVNGVKFSENMLSDGGMTPIISQDLHLTDLLFRYGVRIQPVLVQDLQCLRIPVDVSRDPENPQYQPIPWTYAPILLTSDESPISHNVMQVSTLFASCLEAVGGDDGIQKTVLLATSSASRVTGAPAEVNLSDLTIQQDAFRLQHLPVATSLEGQFTSLFAHRPKPTGVLSRNASPVKCSVPTRQIVVASGNVARNEWQQGKPLPVGYDRYSHIQFGNRDFLTNAVLWLTDDNGLISLRQKNIALRLLNNKRAQSYSKTIQITSVLTPLLLLFLTGISALWSRKKRYA
ncbi:MAG: gliding motility-associated ABC transporter substrate-binding protein GldG [Paludibacteraceae bacterium]|nr:gliding motility-associated ABC transporter substrate-binding protein GldG [Paludibacteraceae bacterium]